MYKSIGVGLLILAAVGLAFVILVPGFSERALNGRKPEALEPKTTPERETPVEKETPAKEESKAEEETTEEPERPSAEIRCIKGGKAIVTGQDGYQTRYKCPDGSTGVYVKW